MTRLDVGRYHPEDRAWPAGGSRWARRLLEELATHGRAQGDRAGEDALHGCGCDRR